MHDRERALADAHAADAALARGEVRGPLHGLPMTVKESFDLAGHPTTQGYPPMRGNTAGEDALAVQRLKAAGAVVFGKTNVPLFLGDFQSYNEIYGTTGNPWDPARTPGGSSGGAAAALAAGLTPLEFGSDIGGSIRNPAAYWGVPPTARAKACAGPGAISSTLITACWPPSRSPPRSRTTIPSRSATAPSW